MATIILNQNSGDFGFDIQDELNHSIQTDSSASNGGGDSGFRPMQLLLAALGSCSAIDIISILKKQRQKINQFKIEVKGVREHDVIPSLWKEVHIAFYLWGDIDAAKAEKAAALSIEKYCSVAETLRRGGTRLQWKTLINQSYEQSTGK